MAKNDGTFPPRLDHPTAGPSALEESRVAIRWHAGGSDEARGSLLADAGLVPAQGEGRRPLLEVNRTAGLWWARPKDGGAVEADAVSRIRLEQERLRARRACLEIELLALELERRRVSAGHAEAVALDVGRWPLGAEPPVPTAPGPDWVGYLSTGKRSTPACPPTGP